jgi:ERCC4-type nuclease
MKGYELEDAMKKMCILVDTREKKNKHVLTALEGRKCPFRPQKLDYGDYTCVCDYPDKNGFVLSDKVAIERKANLDELAGNITRGRERFEREFKRAKADNAKIFLMIENAGFDDIYNHRYRSALPPTSYLNTLFSWQQKYNITISFVPEEFAGDYIYATLFMALKNHLIYGGGDVNA